MKVSWLIEKRIILIEVWQSITMDDVIKLNNTVTHYLSEGHQNTHVICIITDLQSFPTNLRQLTNALDYQKHPHIGWNMTVTDNRVVRFLGSLIYKVSGNSTLRFVASYNDAIEMLQELDSTLPELPETITSH